MVDYYYLSDTCNRSYTRFMYWSFIIQVPNNYMKNNITESPKSAKQVKLLLEFH